MIPSDPFQYLKEHIGCMFSIASNKKHFRKWRNGERLTFEEIGDTDMWRLQDIINYECNVLLADKSYQMIKDLRIRIVKRNKDGWHLIASGFYFSSREGISFWNPKRDHGLPISFCGWADGCNRIPFIIGFIKWCDWMKHPETPSRSGEGEK